MVYELVRNQVRKHGGITEIDQQVLLSVIGVYQLADQADCYERVTAAGRDLLNR